MMHETRVFDEQDDMCRELVLKFTICVPELTVTGAKLAQLFR